jgi:hypothetical protein
MSSTPDTSIDRRLAAFIEQLRLAGWNIGLQQHLDAQRLLLHGRLVSDAAGIERMLGPILCSSRQEQLEFPRYCRPWAKQLLAPIQPTAPSGPSLAQSTMVAPQPLGDQSPRAAKGQATWSRLRSWLRRHRGNLSAGLVLTFAGWAWLAIPDLRAMVAAIGLLILVGLVLRYGRHLWDAFLTRRSARAQQQLETFRAAGLKDRELHHSPGLARSAQRLRRHVEYATNTLDVPRTVVATIRAGNRLTPVYRRARRTPEYLVLIERLSLVDHQARLASTLVDHLRQNEQVAIDTYYFDRDPRYCTADRNGLPARSLADLKTRYPHHRLLIFADAGGFFDPYSGAPQSWIGALRSWHDRALFPLARAAPQADLHGLAADYGMLVLRADEHGIAAFAERDDRARRRIPSVDDAILEPPGILTRLPQRWLAPAPPAEPAQDALVNALERYLGDDGFIWLAACAVYPEGPEMVWLPGGTFTMGSPDGVGEDREHPAHAVQLSHYAVGRYPVTVGEFRRFVEATGYVTEAEQGDGAWVWNRGDPGTRRTQVGATPTWTRTTTTPSSASAGTMPKPTATGSARRPASSTDC